MAVLKEVQLEKISLEFDDDLLTFQHFANYPNLLPYIGKNFSKNEKRVLIIAESHYFPDDIFYKNISAEEFYDRKIKFDDIYFMFTRFELTRKKIHRIHKNLGKHINYSDIAYYNFFLRPASNKLSINIKPIDKEIANNAFKIIVEKLQPNKIIFVSKKSYDNLTIENKNNYKEKIFHCVHPNSIWWNKPMKKHGGKNGKDIFKSILEK